MKIFGDNVYLSRDLPSGPIICGESQETDTCSEGLIEDGVPGEAIIRL